MRKLWAVPATRTSHEDVFVHRYEWLSEWSLKLANHDPDEAADLVQTAFVQFCLRRPDLDAIENLEAYLYTLLRNLRLSQVRRAARLDALSLSVVDYDSLDIGLRAVDPRLQLQAKDDLRAVCRHACSRKESSKSGSVLLLRFFLGYYPTEIAQILRSPVRVANAWLQIARREVRASLDAPQPSTVPPMACRHAAETGEQGLDGSFIDELHAIIAQSCRGACVSREELNRRYGATQSDTIPCARLAHIVSCPHCLDAVSRFLGLDRPSSRGPMDVSGPTPPPSAGSRERQPGHKAGVVRLWHRRLRDVREHSPSELRIAVNGFVVGSLKVRSARSELKLSLTLDEPIGFIEVFSEQSLQMLFLEVEAPPVGPPVQAARVELGEGKHLEVALDFSSAWPTLQTIYQDPDYIAEDAAFAAVAEADAAPAAPAVLEPASRRRPQAPARWFKPFAPAGLNWRLAAAPALVVLTVLGALWASHRWAEPASASELLNKACASEEMAGRAAHVVLHRSLHIEDRVVGRAAGVVRRRVDVWQNAARGLTARRVYDERNQLVAGEWANPDGSRTVYRPGTAPEREAGIRRPALDSRDIWRWEPSARDFAALIATARAKVRDDGNSYRVVFERDRSDTSSGLVEASLWLSKSGLHPLTQIFVVREGTELHEYRFEEAKLERLPEVSVTPERFQPETAAAAPVPTKDVVATPTMTGIAASTSPTTTAPAKDARANAVMLDEIEMGVAYRVHRLESCLSPRSSLERQANGVLRVRATVTNDACEAEAERMLESVKALPSVEVEIVKETPGRAPAETPSDLETIPAYQALYNHFAPYVRRTARQDAAEPTGDEALRQSIRRMAAWAVERSRAVTWHARELRHLTERWSPQALSRLGLDTVAAWQGMVRDHARGLRQETEVLRAQLQPILFPGVIGDVEEKPRAIQDVSDVPAAVDRLCAFAAAQDEALRRAFLPSRDGTRALPDFAALAQEMQQAVLLAETFAEPWPLRRE